MLRRVSDTHDPLLATEIPLLAPLLAQARSPAGAAGAAGLPAVTIGRHPTNAVVLQSAGVPLLLSRHHAAVLFDGEQLTLVDKSTTNGTYVRARARGRC